MIEKHLRNLQLITSGKQQEYYRWLLKYGDRYKARVGAKFEFEPRIKECYRNSMLAYVERGFSYVEGFVVFKDIPIPIEHAFNLCANRHFVVDSTAQTFGFKTEEYFGIVIPEDILYESMNHLYLTPLQLMFRRYESKG